VLYTFYYPPDLCAGSFRSIALVGELSKKLNIEDELHVITTHPNRYASHKLDAKDTEFDKNIIIHRIRVPLHNGNMLSQALSFITYFLSAYNLSKKVNPDFIIGTSSRLMTGILAGYTGFRLNCNYFLDVRDIFSETISDLFYRKNKILGGFSRALFSLIEKRLFSKAKGVNVVSQEFPKYYDDKGIDTSEWAFFPNGIDKIFQDFKLIKIQNTKAYKTILYVGNIGSGQALESILPDAAKKLSANYRFLIIGDGSRRSALKDCVKKRSITNIEILPPVKRDELISYYQEADILFLHLNDIPAFRRVLPSKIFEYAVFGKPIVAGVNGYSADFIRNNIPHSIVFNSGNIDQCVESIKDSELILVDNNQIVEFRNKYSRENIMKDMANHILTLL
jgi:glycosyltransferase involved in cell wall biosynthesis